MADLIYPAVMPEVPGLSVPEEFYTVLPGLAGMAYPRAGTPWEFLYERGYRFVVDLSGRPPGYEPAPLRILQRHALQDLYGQRQPVGPERERERIYTLVQAVLPVWQAGQGIVVHCAGGTGRTGTVIGCLLRSAGYESETVIAYLDELNQVRGKFGWPESDWQADVVRGWPPD